MITRGSWQACAGAALAAFFALLSPAAPARDSAPEAPNAAPAKQPWADIGNHRCLRCHADPEEKVYVRPDGTQVNLMIDTQAFDHSVHGKQQCTGCHTSATKLPHQKPLPKSIGCIECHKQKWEEQRDNPDPKYKRLGVVVQQMESYLHSVHARPNRRDLSRTNAACHDCHDAHNIGTLGSLQRADHRLKNPEVCGRCHEKQKTDYLTSIHGKAIVEKKDEKSAVCSDCHTTHAIESPKGDPMKIAITQNCGDCHKDAQRTYFASYHGQVHRLGFTNTAKCFDCHGGHGVKKIDDPASAVHANNRLETCNKCHKNATEGFLAFHAHGDATNYQKYPGMYVAKTFMDFLIYGVMLFFWTHVILWFWREYQDRRQGKAYVEDLDRPEKVYFRRYSPVWRWLHVLFAISTMTLVLTGTTLLFSHTDWAKAVIALLGGPKVEAIIHRTAATIWLTIFLTHFVIVTRNIWHNRKTFRWFGPTSLIPNLQDLRDIAAMFRWFLGRGARPSFDRWTYWQKFDYWAPFWGAAVIGFSGLMLFFPTRTAELLPGWVFNIATIVHAEEALLATVFLFTVHFFNVHFRPDKFPLSTTIFTGAVPLEEFKHEHKLEYERLVASGELEKYLVRRPSRRADIGSTALATILIFAGLTLLTLVLTGYVTMH
jgi:cytochrome b subunit of formate dehydrogenase